MLKWFKEAGTKLSLLGDLLSQDSSPEMLELKHQLSLMVGVSASRIKVTEIFYEEGSMWAKVEFKKYGRHYQSEVELV